MAERQETAEQLPERTVGFMLSKLGFHAAGGFTAILEPLGIAPPHFAMLSFIASSSGQSQQAMAEALGMPPSRIVAFVDVLEERGLVERRRNPSDRRAHALHLTAKGRALFDQAVAKANDLEARLCSGLTDQERAQLLELLSRIADAQGIPAHVHPGLRTAAVRPPLV